MTQNYRLFWCCATILPAYSQSVVTDAQENRLRDLTKVFLEENQKLNLSAFRTEENCWKGNIMDSVVALNLEEIRTAKSILDIGTGGGFPLLPLAICLPEAQCTGLDSTQKKLDAIGRIAQTLDLQNLDLLYGRAEELGHDPDLRESFDVVTARAVAPLNVLLEYAAPFTKVGGCIVAWKSLNLAKELEESLLPRAEFSCHLEGKHEYDLGGDWGKRQLLIFKKTSPLSEKYPRDTGIPKKEPLK